MNIISRKANRVVVFFRIPKNKQTPMENSMADKITAANKGKKEGNQDSIPKASR